MGIVNLVRNILAPQQKRNLSPETEFNLFTAGLVGPSHRHYVGIGAPTLALHNSVVYSCVKILSETISTLPVRLIDRKTKQEATQHPIYKVLQTPNPDQTWVEFLEMFLANYFTHGNAFAEIETVRGRIVGLYPMCAARTTVLRSGDKLYYEYFAPGNKAVTLTSEQVFHVRMFGHDDHLLQGMSPIFAAERAISLAMTQEKMLIENYSDGVRPDYIIKLPPEKVLERLGQIDADSLKQEKVTLQQQIEASKTRRGLYVPFGYDVSPYSANYQQSQVAEMRDYQVLEIARIWRVPPSKLGVVGKGSSAATAEQQQLSFFQDTLRPILVKLEKRLERTLLSDLDRTRFEIKLNVRALLRGDIATQTTQYTQLWQIGSLTTNEIRESEDLPPFDDPEADKPHWPVNMTTEHVAGANQPTNPADGGIPARSEPLQRPEKRLLISPKRQRSLDARLTASRMAKPMFREAIKKILRKEQATVVRDAKSILGNRSAANLTDRLHQLYSGELREFVQNTIEAPIDTLFDQIQTSMESELDRSFDDATVKKMKSDYLRIFTRDYTNDSLFRLLDDVKDAETEADIIPALEKRFTNWQDGTSDTASRIVRKSEDEPNTLRNVVAKGLYSLAGISILRWVTSGNPCQICDPLADKTFHTKDAPDCPLHAGCDCSLTDAD